jgi:hypothetical protein
MNSNFFYEEGQDNILNEQGDEAIGLKEVVDPYNDGTLLTIFEYRAFQSRLPAGATEELDTIMKEIAEKVTT